MDEIDAIGGRRFSEGTSADREIQRTLMELLNQLDGFDQLGKVCCGYNPVLERIKVAHINIHAIFWLGGGEVKKRWVRG